ncbi:MAG: hypothetical protein WC356_01015 [Candidatus Micrarchaeia archaeon]|jgi:hypothetical protein
MTNENSVWGVPTQIPTIDSREANESVIRDTSALKAVKVLIDELNNKKEVLEKSKEEYSKNLRKSVIDKLEVFLSVTRNPTINIIYSNLFEGEKLGIYNNELVSIFNNVDLLKIFAYFYLSKKIELNDLSHDLLRTAIEEFYGITGERQMHINKGIYFYEDENKLMVSVEKRKCRDDDLNKFTMCFEKDLGSFELIIHSFPKEDSYIEIKGNFFCTGNVQYNTNEIKSIEDLNFIFSISDNSEYTHTD